jgi:ketosteroid isomerase-like protein
MVALLAPAGVLDTGGMTSENLELARRGVEAFNGGDLDAMAELWTDDITIDFSASISPYAGMYSGKDEAKEFLRGVREVWEMIRWEPRELIEVGPDQVLVDNVVRARGRGSGVEVEGHGAQVWTTRDGLLAHARLFQSRGEAEEWLKERS